jgi:L-threonylcarbamoyladenylate synthase
VERCTQIVPVDRDRPDLGAIDAAVAILRAGGLVAFPTETVYGLGADASNPDAVARIYEAKGRPSNNPLIVHGHDVNDVREAVSRWPTLAATLAQRFWPGPLTLVLPRAPNISDAITGGRETVGVRIPDGSVAQSLLQRFGGLIAAPSANRSTGVSPTRAEHVLKDLAGRIDMILDAGPTPVGIESTVLDLSGDAPRILRPGAITARQLGCMPVEEIETSTIAMNDSEAMSSPGQMEVHYAPRAIVRLLDPQDKGTPPWPAAGRYGLIVAGHEFPGDSFSPTVRLDWDDPAVAARELYATLHEWDDEGIEAIYVVLPPNVDAWRAVRDRLWRASRLWARM